MKCTGTIGTQINAHFAALPKQEVDLGGRKKFLCQPQLDSWCADELGIYLSMKQITNLMSKKVVLLKGEEVLTLKFDPKALEVMTPQNKTWCQEISERLAGMEIINGLKSDALRAKLISLGAVKAPVI